MKDNSKKIIRCAIYTRKSTEEGLEQDFNSLDAQREACESYIKSQQHEGWVLVEKHYDDGGFSGGTLQRPALQELFGDIEKGLVDTIVVYKVDRLTRSLMDFSKIVELFDKHKASFVSITQHFNTTTSMGRLTLNILLSFAQFEREVTGERIRDKFAASKKKGMWMGGRVPIGYKNVNRKLEIDEDRANDIRIIFEKYLELKSVSKLREYLITARIRTQSGLNFSKGNLYKILSNKIYLGQIKHKGNCYDGEHDAIVAVEIFEETQKMLQQNRINKLCGVKCASYSLLAGKIYDDKGNKMSPSHSNTRKRKYRYYLSQAIKNGNFEEAGSLNKIPAGEIESFVINIIKEYLNTPRKVQMLIKNFDLREQSRILKWLPTFDGYDDVKFVRGILHKVIVSLDSVKVIFCSDRLAKSLRSMAVGKEPLQESSETQNPIEIFKNIKLRQYSCSGGNRLIIAPEGSEQPVFNFYLIKAIAKSHHWNNLLVSGEAKNAKDIQRIEGLKDSTYVKQVLNLRFLSPEIVQAILEGRQPVDLSLGKLFKVRTQNWVEQKKILKL